MCGRGQRWDEKPKKWMPYVACAVAATAAAHGGSASAAAATAASVATAAPRRVHVIFVVRGQVGLHHERLIVGVPVRKTVARLGEKREGEKADNKCRCELQSKGPVPVYTARAGANDKARTRRPGPGDAASRDPSCPLQPFGGRCGDGQMRQRPAGRGGRAPFGSGATHLRHDAAAEANGEDEENLRHNHGVDGNAGVPRVAHVVHLLWCRLEAARQSLGWGGGGGKWGVGSGVVLLRFWRKEAAVSE